MRRASSEYARTPVAFAHERRDCAVRALRIVAGCTYEAAHKTLSIYGRAPKRCTSHNASGIAARLYGLKEVALQGRPTLTQFLKEHPKGRYMLRRQGHMFALVDGIVHDWRRTDTGPRSRIKTAWVKP